MMQHAMMTAVLMACIATGWCQEYYEASGQTAVFTLAAGARAGSSAIRSGQSPCGVATRGISISVARSGIVITLPISPGGMADIAFHNIAGRQIYRQTGYYGKTARFEAGLFQPGIYAVRVCVDGQIYARRFVITGQGA